MPRRRRVMLPLASDKLRSAVHNFAATGSVSWRPTVLWALRIPWLRGDGSQPRSMVQRRSVLHLRNWPSGARQTAFRRKSSVNGRASLIRGRERGADGGCSTATSACFSSRCRGPMAKASAVPRTRKPCARGPGTGTSRSWVMRRLSADASVLKLLGPHHCLGYSQTRGVPVENARPTLLHQPFAFPPAFHKPLHKCDPVQGRGLSSPSD
ncbi:hypothetical protein T440DRAFT_305184 [Plenodomus tracheiphilus IPT5]|uniref:Uncharacterized protein n=1 Tax=Plenodomus tracheiphilus IPT5 TaxID=1408161 RepID=A0A6A7BFY0_9PLEO|nr:hypothetical protein T440DRAFT_305184 [Plenodomus tracheiphilus IPT5]